MSFDFFKLDINLGLNYDVFRQGIYQVYVQNENLAEKMFESVSNSTSGKIFSK